MYRPLTEKFMFENDNGEKLAGKLDLPLVGQAEAFAVFAHCFSCSKDLPASRNIAAQLAAQGIGVLRFDFTGLGSSQGEFANSHYRANVQDLVAAVRAMTQAGMPPSMLVGHSLGGAAALEAGARLAQIKAVATIGAPADPAHAVERLSGDLAVIRATGKGAVEIAGRRFDISASFLDGMQGYRGPGENVVLGAALLVLHSPVDAIVGIENATKIFSAVKHPKSFIGLDQADHLLSLQEDADHVAQLIAAWAKRYLPSDARANEGHQDYHEGQVVVRETGNGKYQQTASSGRHTLVADEPAVVGGLDSGMAPYDLLLAGLGACTNMTLRMYAERKGWPMDGVSVAMRHRKIHAKDCATCESASGKVDEIDRTLRIEGEALTQEQRARLREIADMCPVHRTLHHEVKINTVLE